MKYYNEIEHKLNEFYKRFYISLLIKGILLFIAFGLSYFLITSLVEYFLWLPMLGRKVLFWIFIGVQVYLLFQLIGKPILKLFRASKGISNEELSKIIGKHFKEVEDKLLNVLQLRETKQQSEFLVASIEQKAKELSPIPFYKAINYRINVKYLKFTIPPILLVSILYFNNTKGDFFNSFERVVNYQTSFTPPAPFQFIISSHKLTTLQGEDFKVRVLTKGQIVPDEAKIIFENQEYFLKSMGPGEFEFTFSQLEAPVTFYIEANKIRSKNYSISVLNTPRITSVSLDLEYPGHTNQKNKRIDSPSNLIVPEGTKINWIVNTQNTEKLLFTTKKTKEEFLMNQEGYYNYQKQARNSFYYQISSSNKNIENYETLDFSVNVIKDELPKIEVQSNIDSVKNDPIFFIGQISDDYGIKKLQLVYHKKNTQNKKEILTIPISKENLQSFYYDFPGELNLEEGVGYELYFEVFDNDGVNGSKKTQSKTFQYRVQTQEEINEKLIEEQRDYINKLERSLTAQKQQKKEVENLQRDLQNKQNMNWNDQKKIESLIQRQNQYQQMMEKQSNNLLKNLDDKKEDNETLQTNKEELKKRIEELKKLEKQKKLLEELEKLANKLDKDELVKKTKELAEQNKQQERSLERILELTKRFYVEQKMTQIANKLDELSKEQAKLSNNESKDIKQQQKASEKFNKLEKELEELLKDNEKLKSPMDIPDVSDEQYDVKKEQKSAEESIDKQNNSDAKKSQKNAAKKMQQMSQKMQQAMTEMQANSIQENADDLRKILKNLITFSFQQEDLLNKFEQIDFQHPDFGKNLRRQNEIKTYFEHIDDSLYMLSMRVPQISTKIQNDLANAHYNLNESLENFSERRFNSGTSNQQFVLTSTNNISDFLSDLLNNMNNTMSASGQGKSSESFSLPTIIKQQEGLTKKMKEGMGKQESKKGNQEQGKQKGQGYGEENSGELYKIFQEQNQLKNQLQNLIQQGNDSKGEGIKVVKSIEQLENEILEKGFSQEVLQRMQNIEYQLLKLDKAQIEQNKDNKRKSNTNTKSYNKPNLKEVDYKKLFYNQLEILNRQSLPLQQNYKMKVQEYFSKPLKGD